jgi:hypothetical protein
LDLDDFTGSFRNRSSLEKLKLIRQDWGRLLMVKKDEGIEFESSSSKIKPYGEITGFLE